MPLTISKIKTFKPRPHRYKVTDGNGLALEVRPSGGMSWRWRYRLRSKPAEINLGRFPQVSLASARERCLALKAAIAAGRSPAEQRRMEKQAEMRGMTVKAFGEKYLQDIVARARKNPKVIQRYLERDIYPAIGAKSMAAVQKQDLRALIYAKRDEGHEQAALAIRNLLKRLWDYAIELEMTDVNPAALIKAKFVAQVSSRSRALSEAEIGLFLRALGRSRMRTDLKIALQLILLTLTRKSELRLARWEEFDLARAEWSIPPSHSKTDAAQIVYLSSQACALIEQLAAPDRRTGCVFPMQGGRVPMAPSTLNKALKRLKLNVAHFTVHDLRRSAATILSEQEFNSDWIEKALNHKIKGVRGVYNRAQYATQRRTMLQAWADWLEELKQNTR